MRMHLLPTESLSSLEAGQRGRVVMAVADHHRVEFQSFVFFGRQIADYQFPLAADDGPDADHMLLEPDVLDHVEMARVQLQETQHVRLRDVRLLLVRNREIGIAHNFLREVRAEKAAIRLAGAMVR